MSRQRLVETCFWDDSYIIKLDPSEKLLFLYLLTNPLTTICGIYEISIRRIAFDTGFEADTVQRILGRFERDNRCIYRNGWLAMRNWIKHQTEAPGVQKGIELQLARVPEDLATYVQSQEGVEPPLDRVTGTSNLNLIESNLEDSPVPPAATPAEVQPKRKKKPETDPTLKPLVQYYLDKHKAVRGFEPTPAWPRDMKIMQRLRGSYKPEAIRQLLDMFFAWKGRSNFRLRAFADKVDTLYGVLKDKAEGKR